MRNILYFLAFVSGLALADNPFPQWPKITVSELTKAFPEFVWEGIPGSVGQKKSSEIKQGCPIRENGKIVGWSLSCFSTLSGPEQAGQFY